MASLVLAVTTDPDLLEEVRAAGAAAGALVLAAGSPATAGAQLAGADAVVIGADQLVAYAASGAVRRPGVVVAAPGTLAVTLWPTVLDVGAEQVLELPRDRAALVVALGRPPAGDGALVVGVVGGRGGAGASLLTARLAAAFAAAGSRVLALDADPDGPGLDVVLAMESVPGARWSQLADLQEVLPPQALRDALPTRDGLAVLAHEAAPGPVPAPPVLARLLDSASSAYDVVVVDLPRGRDDVLEALVPRCAQLLVAVTSDVCGAASAARTLRRLRPAGPARPVRLVVREMPGSDLAPEDLVGWLDTATAAELPHDPRLATAVDHGLAPSPRSRWSRTVRDLARLLAAEHRPAA